MCLLPSWTDDCCFFFRTIRHARSWEYTHTVGLSTLIPYAQLYIQHEWTTTKLRQNQIRQHKVKQVFFFFRSVYLQSTVIRYIAAIACLWLLRWIKETKSFSLCSSYVLYKKGMKKEKRRKIFMMASSVMFYFWFWTLEWDAALSGHWHRKFHSQRVRRGSEVFFGGLIGWSWGNVLVILWSGMVLKNLQDKKSEFWF